MANVDNLSLEQRCVETAREFIGQEGLLTVSDEVFSKKAGKNLDEVFDFVAIDMEHRDIVMFCVVAFDKDGNCIKARHDFDTIWKNVVELNEQAGFGLRYRADELLFNITSNDKASLKWTKGCNGHEESDTCSYENHAELDKEKLAKISRMLETLHMELISTNWIGEGGERIDVIAKDKDTWSFIDVRVQDENEHLTRTAREQAVIAYLRQLEPSLASEFSRSYRFDNVEISDSGRVAIFKNALGFNI